MSFVQARPPATHDFYGAVHKGLRRALSQILIRLGSADPADSDLPGLLADLRDQCRLSEHHLDNEDQVIHPALEARVPGSTQRLSQAHDHHRAAFGEIEAMTRQVEAAPAAAKAARLKALYLRFSVFVAEDFAHMAEEEQFIMPILQSLFTDEELAGMEDRILSALAPEEMVAMGRMMIPAATRTDRISMLGALRANAPAEAFGAIIELAARPALSPADFAHLSEGLGLAA
ncbi:MAG TPA: hemerythrin domain-containing protein [Phenylobacterium sp.]|nr:hemerythrin domain-containing protein [Phenylobacterium sp.]